MDDDSLLSAALWAIFAISLLASFTWRFFRRRVVGDIEMLQLGGVIYLAVPFLLYYEDALDGYPAIDNWKRLFEAAGRNGLSVLAFSVGVGIFYWIGRSIKAP